MLVPLFLVTGLIWAASLWFQRSNLDQDIDAYRQFAQNLCDTHTYSRTLPGGERCPSDFRPPLFPWLLAAISGATKVSSLQIAVVHWCCGLLIVGLTYRIGSRIHRRIGLIAAAMVSIDPLLLHWSSYPMTETVATVVAMILLEFSMRVSMRANHTIPIEQQQENNQEVAPSRSMRHLRFLVFWGAAFGVAALCRPAFLAWGCLIAAGLVYSGPKRRDWRSGLAFLIGCAVVVTPWAIRNGVQVGKVTPLTTHGGYTLLLANNSFYYSHLRKFGWRNVWYADELEPLLQEHNLQVPTECSPFEVEHDRKCKQLALDAIMAEPAMFAYATGVRVLQLWSPLPHAQLHHESFLRKAVRYATALWYVAIYYFAVVGFWTTRNWKRGALVWVGLAGCLSFTLVHSIYFSNMRMRTPLMPWIYLLAAFGLVAIFDHFRKCKTDPSDEGNS